MSTPGIRPLMVSLALLCLSACAGHTPVPDPAPPEQPAAPLPLASSSPVANSDQLVVVTTRGWDSTQGELHRYERRGRHWQEMGQGTVVSVGRNGVAWGLGLHSMPQPGPQKQEGDGRSPAGVFNLPGAFGYGPTGHSLMPYQAMAETDWCIDVVDSPFYNRIINAREQGEAAIVGSSEPMRLDLHNAGDIRYALGLRVAHNPQAIAGKGSCIFLHLWREPGEATAGCTAMDDSTMQSLLAWLDPRRHPVLVLLPESEYNRLTNDWRLPALSVLQ